MGELISTCYTSPPEIARAYTSRRVGRKFLSALQGERKGPRRRRGKVRWAGDGPESPPSPRPSPPPRAERERPFPLPLQIATICACPSAKAGSRACPRLEQGAAAEILEPLDSRFR